MKRALLFGVLWLAATVATGAVAWGAVRLAGERTGEEALRPLSVQQVQALATSTTAVAPTTAPETTPSTASSTTAMVPAGSTTTSVVSTTGERPTSTTAPAAAARQTRGGTVVVSSAGTRLSLVSATPAAGYAVDVEEAGPDEVRVVFEGAGEEIRVHAEIEEGRVVFSVEEGAAEDD